jgi:hypothetical protein
VTVLAVKAWLALYLVRGDSHLGTDDPSVCFPSCVISGLAISFSAPLRFASMISFLHWLDPFRLDNRDRWWRRPKGAIDHTRIAAV